MAGTKDYRIVLPRVLAQSAVVATKTGDTVETTLATITIPGGALGATGRIRVSTIWTITNNANAKNIRVRLGGIGGTAFQNVPISTAATAAFETHIANRGAVASQVGWAFGCRFDQVFTSFTPVTGSLNTAIDQDLVITAQLAVGTDSATLEAYMVEILR